MPIQLPLSPVTHWPTGVIRPCHNAKCHWQSKALVDDLISIMLENAEQVVVVVVVVVVVGGGGGGGGGCCSHWLIGG